MTTPQATTPPPTTLAEHTVRTLDVKRSYKMGSETVNALRGVSISINRGEYISIMGPSGSGKSTLFNMIGGLDKPSEGKVYIDEVDIAQLDSYELAWMRCHKIGYIFQTFNLIPVMTALENVMMPMIFAGLNTADAQDKAAAIFTRDGDAARDFAAKVNVGMVGINVPIPVPIAYYTFGGWKKSGFGDLNQHGPDSIRFYTKTKTVTARWPSGVKEGAEFSIPTMN